MNNLIIDIKYDYKFRARSPYDVDVIIYMLRNDTGAIDKLIQSFDNKFPLNIIAEFSSLFDIDYIRELLLHFDSDILISETLNYSDKYTGERYYIK